MRELSPLERELINRYQGGFPIAGRPYARVAERLGSDETALLSTISRLLEEGWLTRFGPLYNVERLGGAFVLAAMAVPEEVFDQTAGILDRLPEVAHNYRRDHRLNMWFVLAAETAAAVQGAIDEIEARASLAVYAFPKEREYYLGLWVELGADGRCTTRSLAPVSGPEPEIGELDRRIVEATQDGLPLTPEPCETLARTLGCAAGEVVARMEHLLRCGVIRRIGAVPNHYKLGLRGNGMAVWDVPDERRDEVGRRVGALDFVSHCYARPRRLPLWPYNLFAMVHGANRDEVRGKVESISRLVSGEARAHEVLFSSAVLKKTGVRLPA